MQENRGRHQAMMLLRQKWIALRFDTHTRIAGGSASVKSFRSKTWPSPAGPLNRPQKELADTARIAAQEFSGYPLLLHGSDIVNLLGVLRLHR
jgi:hypothetical protein